MKMSKRYDPLKVLFVEDEKGTRERVTRLLQRRFSQVLVAENGEQGWELFCRHEPHVLLTDLNLPDITGLFLINRIREVNEKTAILIITAYNETEYLLEAIELGVSNFLTKPLNIEKMDQAMDKIHHSFSIEEELERQRKHNRIILDFQESLVIVTDGRIILEANQRFNEFFNISGEDAQELEMADVFRVIDDLPSFHEFREDEWETYTNKVMKMIIPEADTGIERCFHMKVARFPDQPRLKIISFTDVTELENERQYYQQLAIIDPLTQIYNRIQFNRSLAEEIQKSKRFHSVFSLVMFDIDHFKQINDTYGHQLGDTILMELTEVVRKNIREIDIFARFGGEEFMILTPETDLHGAAVMAEKLRQEIEENAFSHGETLTCSFGVSMYKSNDKPDDMIKRVDDRLYKAKNNGRNQVWIPS